MHNEWNHNRLTSAEAEQFIADLIRNSINCHQHPAGWLMFDEDGSTYGTGLPTLPPNGNFTCRFPEASLKEFRHANGVMFAQIIRKRDHVQLITELLEATTLNRDMAAEFLGFSTAPPAGAAAIDDEMTSPSEPPDFTSRATTPRSPRTRAQLDRDQRVVDHAEVSASASSSDAAATPRYGRNDTTTLAPGSANSSDEAAMAHHLASTSIFFFFG